ncbi:glutamine--fructose-6-phosphate transaminase (isomerizing) [Myxococcota bacterium]|nr:glutamine--fructose-6-phosphate transaminase (isomerizing) [Myxococcota bacterium]
MCGIVGYVGERDALPILLEGLKRLEYRGYDSSGVALPVRGRLKVHKKAGKIREMERTLPQGLSGTSGIAHTRWATHGAPTDLNAHPHVSNDGRIAVVHNGIIENYAALKTMLQQDGCVFASETDTEVFAHLIAKFYRDDLESAVRNAIHYIKGTYGIAVVASDRPDEVVCARNGSPIVLGIGEKEMFVASDVTAIIAHTQQVIYLADGDVAVLHADSYRTTNADAERVDKDVQEVDWRIEEIEKGDFPHFMLKEIHEQRESIERCFRGRVIPEFGTTRLGGLNLDRREFFDIQRLKMLACGTSFHAALVASYLFENLARVPCQVEVASEFRYKNPIIDKNTLYFAISQSGETADTLAALREIQRKGGRVLGVVNVVGSTIARESDGGIYIRSGPEIAVASTKAFTSQIVALFLFAVNIGRMRDMSPALGRHLVEELAAIPGKVGLILERAGEVERLARKYLDSRYVLFLGRGVSYPVALEGALKLKEISYIHAEGLPAAEMKHGPIALINEETPVVFVAPRDELFEKTLSNMEEVRARKGRILAITNEHPTDRRVEALAEDVIYVPDTHEALSPLLTVIPLQLFSYHAAVRLGRDVDQPRNLAKSVTVE